MTPPEQAPASLPTPATPAIPPVSDSTAPSAAASPAGAPVAASSGNTGAAWVWTSAVLGVAATVAVVSSVMLWQRLNNIQQQLALQSADSRGQAVEARTLARQAEDTTRDTASRMSVLEARVGEVALQRGQLEELMQSLSRNRDDNMVSDIEGAIRFAMQQTQLSGSPDPLVSALKTAQQRVIASAQPRLAPLERAMARDLDRIATSKSLDTAGLLARMDDLLRQVDDLPLQNDVAANTAARRSTPARNKDSKDTNHSHNGTGKDSAADAEAAPSWWSTALGSVWNAVHDEARSLVRVSRIDQPEAILLAPEQTFFLRENLKLKLLNARLGLLARQFDSARADLNGATAALNKYFDPTSRRTQNAASALQQAQASMKTAELPRLDETLSALATAAAGR